MAEPQDDVVEKIESEREDLETGVPAYKILSYPSDPTLELLNMKLDREDILMPPFQRGWVWTPVQASRLIESFLLGLPVPPIFVYRDRAQKQRVIDGQQRLTTVSAFFNEQLPTGDAFYLKGVSPQWEGKKYSDISESEKVLLRESLLRTIIVEQLHPQDDTSIYQIFERLNTGGTSLSPQEVRNCVYHGPLNDVLLELNRLPAWRKVFGREEPDSRMRDVELIVRFCALWEGGNQYSKPMKQFINSFMSRHQWDTDVESYRTIFTNTIQKAYSALGSKPFHIHRGINAAVFDSVILAFAAIDEPPADASARFERLLHNPSYEEAVSAATTDVDTVKRRIDLAREVFSS